MPAYSAGVVATAPDLRDTADALVSKARAAARPETAPDVTRRANKSVAPDDREGTVGTVGNPAVSVYDVRHASRALTRRTMADEEPALLRERDELLDRKYESGLDVHGERRLTYVRWQLDRIDDALNGEHLDAVERVVSAQEQMAGTIDEYAHIVRGYAGSRHPQQIPVAEPARARRRRR